MAKKEKKSMGVQQVLLSPDKETLSILRYLCEQSGKLYNNGVYFARQTDMERYIALAPSASVIVHV